MKIETCHMNRILKSSVLFAILILMTSCEGYYSYNTGYPRPAYGYSRPYPAPMPYYGRPYRHHHHGYYGGHW